MKLSSKWALLAVCALMVSFSSSAQETTGTIRGTALDASGGTVSGATVSATQMETGLARTVSSDSAGAFVILAFPVGHYRVEADAKGFRKFVQDGVKLDVNQTATLTLRLAVGAKTETVEILENAPLIESTTHEPR